MSTKLYVENLSTQVSSDDIQELFKEAGAVTSIEIVEDPRSSDTYVGIVKMVLKKEAEAAIEAFHDREFFGRLLRVVLAPHGSGDEP